MHYIEKNTKWLSVYIYTGSPDKILIKKIAPLVQSILKKQLAQKFFFIRYHDNLGFHIRLRLKGEEEILNNKILPILRNRFQKYRIVPYRKEFRRYGGKCGTDIAEDVFESSSKVILSFLNDNNTSEYNDKLNFAMHINLIMICAFGLKKDEAILFFDHNSKTDKLEYFEENNELEIITIFRYFQKLWNKLEKNGTFDNNFYNTYIRDLISIGIRVQNAYNRGELIPSDSGTAHQQHPLWYLYESYIHMNNNRLGIFTIDEAYIAYIIKKSLIYEG